MTLCSWSIPSHHWAACRLRWTLGKSTSRLRIAEGIDDAARLELRRRQRARPRGAPHGRPAHAILGLRPYAKASPIYQKYAGTPPMHLMFALRRALDLLFEEGLDNVFIRHHLLAEAVRRAVEVWKKGNVIDFISPKAAACRYGDDRADQADGWDPRLLRKYCDATMRRGARARNRTNCRQGIPHRPHGAHQCPDGAGHARVVETALGAMRIPHGQAASKPRCPEWLSERVQP